MSAQEKIDRAIRFVQQLTAMTRKNTYLSVLAEGQDCNIFFYYPEDSYVYDREVANTLAAETLNAYNKGQSTHPGVAKINDTSVGIANWPNDLSKAIACITAWAAQQSTEWNGTHYSFLHTEQYENPSPFTISISWDPNQQRYWEFIAPGPENTKGGRQTMNPRYNGGSIEFHLATDKPISLAEMLLAHSGQMVIHREAKSATVRLGHAKIHLFQM